MTVTEPQMDTHYTVYRQIKYFVGELVGAKVTLQAMACF